MATATAKATAVEKAAKDDSVVSIPPMDWQMMRVRIRGTAPLVMGARGDLLEKLKGKQTGEASEGRQIKDPKKEREKATHRDGTGKLAMPSVCFKHAMTCSITKGLKFPVSKKDFKRVVYVEGQWVRIEVDEAKVTTDERIVVIPSSGAPDVRFRPMIPEGWEATLTIRFRKNRVSQTQLIQLIIEAGLSGVGEGRPSKESELGWGTFEVLSAEVTR